MATLSVEDLAAPKSDDAKKEVEELHQSREMKKASRKLAVFLLSWLFLVVVGIGITKYFKEEFNAEYDAEDQLAKDRFVAEVQNAQRIIENSVDECEGVLTEFVNAPSVEVKAQLVYRGRDLTAEMNRYYKENPIYVTDKSRIKILRAELIRNVSNEVMSALCINTRKELFEVVFVRSEKQWRIDWLSFVRFGTPSWPSFFSGEDGDEGEFRLYMRVRESTKGLEAEELSLIFYEPDIYMTDAYKGEPSKDIVVSTKTEAGKKILDLVRGQKEGKKNAYKTGANVIDPLGYFRVRIRMKLHKEEKGTRFEILDLLGNHWFGDEVLGEELPPEEIPSFIEEK